MNHLARLCLFKTEIIRKQVWRTIDFIDYTEAYWLKKFLLILQPRCEVFQLPENEPGVVQLEDYLSFVLKSKFQWRHDPRVVKVRTIFLQVVKTIIKNHHNNLFDSYILYRQAPRPGRLRVKFEVFFEEL